MASSGSGMASVGGASGLGDDCRRFASQPRLRRRLTRYFTSSVRRQRLTGPCSLRSTPAVRADALSNRAVPLSFRSGVHEPPIPRSISLQLDTSLYMLTYSVSMELRDIGLRDPRLLSVRWYVDCLASLVGASLMVSSYFSRR